MAELSTPTYELVIERSRPGLRISWREFWEYRDLLAMLVQRDYIARYKQTLLGPAWFLLQPLLTTAIFAFVFSRIAGIPTDGIPAPLFYLCGLLGWNYFAQNLTGGGATFVTNQALFTKVWFPRLVIPLAAAGSNLIAVALQLIPVAAFFVYYKFFTAAGASIHPGWQALLLPLPIAHLAALSLGASLCMAATTAKFRDLIHLNSYLVQLWMFATPVIYPISQIPSRYAWLAWANPAAVPIEMVRWCLLGTGTVDPVALAISLAVTVVLLAVGAIAFNHAARSAVDTI